MLIGFWYPDPRRIWAALLLIPIGLMRCIARGHIWTRTPLDGVWMVFLGLCVVNIILAGNDAQIGQDTIPPFTRGLLMLGRPLLGIALAGALVESARVRGSMERVLWALIAFGALVVILGAGASAWSDKSDLFRPILDALPRLPNWEIIRGGFNVNEIGGVLATIVPIMAGIALIDKHPFRRWIAAALFWIGLAAAFAGQSRLALAGIIAALFGLTFLLIPRWRWRVIALIGLIALTVVEILIVSGVLSTGRPNVNARDESSWRARLYIWESAAEMTFDYPLTGVGLNMFRDGRVRALYPVPGYETQVLPHAHNEWLQLAADLGLPGVLTFGAWHAILAALCWRMIRAGDSMTRGIAIAGGAGIASHAVFGLGDAIPLWDRFAFIQYVATGLILAQYAVFRAEVRNRK
jgi:O-antigen ligase